MARDFAAHAKGRKQPRLEYWYRELRQKHGVLMDGQRPVGGQWNFDADHPGSLDRFAWPVNRTDALRALDNFIENRLPCLAGSRTRCGRVRSASGIHD